MFTPHQGGDDPYRQVSDDDNLSSGAVSDDDGGGGLGRFRKTIPDPEEEDIFAPEIHVEEAMPRRYFAWLPGLFNNCAHSFVGGCAYVLIQYLSRKLSERHQRSTEEAIRAREEELQYLHYASTH